METSVPSVTGRIARAVLTAAAAVFSLCTILSLAARVHAVAEIFSNGQLHLLLIGLWLIPFALLARLWRVALLVLLLCVPHAVSVFPYFTAAPDAIADAPTATVLQYNIWFANDDYGRIAGVINQSDADVVALQELTDSQWAVLSPLLTNYPHQVAVPVSDDTGELGGGMALLSRSPLTPVTVDSKANEPARPILAIRTTVAGAEVTVIGLHPHASRFSASKVRLRNAQLDAVTDLARAATGPVVIMSDMNITPTSPDYGDFVDDLGWRDPHELAGWHASWPAVGRNLGFPIDHIFVSNEILLHDYEMGDGAGSDHRTLTATVSIP